MHTPYYVYSFLLLCAFVCTLVYKLVVFVVHSLCACSSTDSSVMSDWVAENPVVSTASVRKSSRKRYVIELSCIHTQQSVAASVHFTPVVLHLVHQLVRTMHAHLCELWNEAVVSQCWWGEPE